MTEAEVQNAKNEKIRNELALAYKRLFMTDDGKRVYADLEKFCGFLNTSVCEQLPDALQTMFKEGERRVFLHIKSLIDRKIEGKDNG